ncbi:MAG: hypothetical protein JWQ11_2224 [Rhizobacter sp.]|nr:hypothetical protein [Rhizobacter sp.]
MSAAAVVALAGCSTIGGITGGVAGIASGSATGSPGVGIAVGIGVKAAVDASIKKVLRRWSDEEQTRIAMAVGAMNVGETRPWSVEHPFGYNDSNGRVTLLRSFDTPLASCREALFTVDGAKDAPVDSAVFKADFCQGDSGWRWAVAEPAVGRWGSLQ